MGESEGIFKHLGTTPLFVGLAILCAFGIFIAPLFDSLRPLSVFVKAYKGYAWALMFLFVALIFVAWFNTHRDTKSDGITRRRKARVADGPSIKAGGSIIVGEVSAVPPQTNATPSYDIDGGAKAPSESSIEDANIAPSMSQSTVFFDYRMADAFPGLDGLTWFDKPKDCAIRIEALLAQPLTSSGYAPIWWFRGGSNLSIDHFDVDKRGICHMGIKTFKLK
jgi:hypothetical protein